MRGRVNSDTNFLQLGGVLPVMDKLVAARRFVICACGTSWHSGLVGEYLIEDLARVPVEVEYASEFRYRKPILYPDDVIIVISQSGETADTLAAVREAKRQGKSNWEKYKLLFIEVSVFLINNLIGIIMLFFI